MYVYVYEVYVIIVVNYQFYSSQICVILCNAIIYNSACKLSKAIFNKSYNAIKIIYIYTQNFIYCNKIKIDVSKIRKNNLSFLSLLIK